MNGHEDWTFWLMMTNLALALVVLGAVVTVVTAVVWDVLSRRARQARQMRSMDEEMTAMLRAESHRILVPELGMTMADGGEKLEPSDDASRHKNSKRN